MRVCRSAAKHEFDVGHRQLRTRLDEGVQSARHHGAGPAAEQVRADHAQRHAIEPHFPAERARVQALEKDDDSEVILQILADGQIVQRLDTNLVEMRGRADS